MCIRDSLTLARTIQKSIGGMIFKDTSPQRRRDAVLRKSVLRAPRKIAALASLCESD